MITTCPQCSHTFDTDMPRKGKRVCCKCKNVIGKRHKWIFNEDGTIQHRHCDDPEVYVSKKENVAENLLFKAE